ncbi:aminopeptidase [Symbiobacterium thermophilum]|nr:aminopeptidase [Symbiobacterium thermophilum]BAD41937.1 putative aminopeptidase [Symbiobacterium thermophilum IAM 14863]
MVPRWAGTVLQDSLGLRPGERVLVLADRPLAPAAAALDEAARALGAAEVKAHLLPDPDRLQVVPRWITDAVRSADAIVSLRAALRLAAEDALMRAALDAFHRARRGRWVSMAQVDVSVLETALAPGLAEAAARARALAARLRAAAGVRLTAPGGTDLQLTFAGRPVHADTGWVRQPGDFGNLPAGEAYVAPDETGAEGLLVVDVALGDIPLDRPVALRFRRGRVAEVTGGEAAAELRRRLGNDPWAWTVGELGLGTNPHVRPCGRVAVAEKALGTAHVALGGNLAFGGRNPASTHYDCVIAAADVRFL